MAATVAAASVMAVTLEPDRAVVGLAMIVATLWGTAPLVGLIVSSTRTSAGDDGADPGDHVAERASAAGDPVTGAVTTVVRVGDEPAELVAGAVELARGAGPVVVVGRRPPFALDGGVRDLTGTPVGEALTAAACEVGTPAVLIVSGRVAVQPAAVRRAAGSIAHGVDWVTGATRSFNDDRFVPERRDVVGRLLRRRATGAGLALWEPDATIVSTALLRDAAPEPGRPYGRWLRGCAAAGATGVLTELEPALRAAPVAARDHWPDAVARQRAVAADLADATVARGTGSGGFRGRIVAGALLLRELYAWPLLVWLAAPVLLSAGTPFRVHPAAGAAALLGLAVARWATLRHALGVRPSPRADVLAAVSGLPGSLSALTSAVSRRVRPHPRSYPARPLAWLALLAVVVNGIGLVGIEPGTPGSRTAALICIALLVGLWILTVRALVERTWERTSFRVPVAIPVEVAGDAGRIVDASPVGVAVAVTGAAAPAGAAAPGPGDDVVLELPDDGADGCLRLDGVVVARRRRAHELVLGVELRLGEADRARWVRRLAGATSSSAAPPTDTPATRDVAAGLLPRRRLGALVDRAAFLFVVAVSITVLVALVLVLLGFRPLVIRSSSMAPTYHPGDLVVTDRVRASDVAAGDVVSLDHYPPIGESMTHRVQSARADGANVTVVTKGDANDSGETWTTSADQRVGKVVASIPAVGRPAILVRTSWSVALIASLLVAPIVLVVLRGRRRPRRSDRGDPVSVQ